MRVVLVAVLLVACGGEVEEPTGAGLLGLCETSADCADGLLCQRERALWRRVETSPVSHEREWLTPAEPRCVPPCERESGVLCAIPVVAQPVDGWMTCGGGSEATAYEWRASDGAGVLWFVEDRVARALPEGAGGQPVCGAWYAVQSDGAPWPYRW